MSGAAPATHLWGLTTPNWTEHEFEKAKEELALEILKRLNPNINSARMKWSSQIESSGFSPGQRLCPDYDQIKERAVMLIRRCDARFRCSEPGHVIPPFTGHDLVWDADQARYPRNTEHFESARFCYVSPYSDVSPFELESNLDIMDFSNALLGYDVAPDAYGKHGRVVELAIEACDAFKRAEHHTAAVIQVLKGMKYLGTPPTVADRADALKKLEDSMITLPPFGDMNSENLARRVRAVVMSRFNFLNKATSKWKDLLAAVCEHCKNRRMSGKCTLVDLPDDCWDPLALYVNNTHSIAALMQTCTSFAKMARLRARLPSPVPRKILGCFPHMQRVSRDRTDLAAGVTRPVLRNFVLANKAVRLYVDFCTTELRPVPLKKKERSDGLDNRDHDFSDDEFEEPPEALSNRGPFCIPDDIDTTTEWGRVAREAQLKSRNAWIAHEGPQEPPKRYTYKKRTNYNKYLTDVPDIVASLVFADDKTPVPDMVNPGALELSLQMRKENGVFKQPNKIKHVPFPHVPGNAPHSCLPAFAKFHVKHLSTTHGGRLFCIKLEAKGMFSVDRGGKPAQWISYTEPFEVVSKMEVVHNASDRSVQCKRKPESLGSCANFTKRKPPNRVRSCAKTVAALAQN